MAKEDPNFTVEGKDLKGKDAEIYDYSVRLRDLSFTLYYMYQDHRLRENTIVPFLNALSILFENIILMKNSVQIDYIKFELDEKGKPVMEKVLKTDEEGFPIYNSRGDKVYKYEPIMEKIGEKDAYQDVIVKKWIPEMKITDKDKILKINGGGARKVEGKVKKWISKEDVDEKNDKILETDSNGMVLVERDDYIVESIPGKAFVERVEPKLKKGVMKTSNSLAIDKYIKKQLYGFYYSLNVPDIYNPDSLKDPLLVIYDMSMTEIFVEFNSLFELTKKMFEFLDIINSSLPEGLRTEILRYFFDPELFGPFDRDNLMFDTYISAYVARQWIVSHMQGTSSTLNRLLGRNTIFSLHNAILPTDQADFVNVPTDFNKLLDFFVLTIIDKVTRSELEAKGIKEPVLEKGYVLTKTEDGQSIFKEPTPEQTEARKAIYYAALEEYAIIRNNYFKEVLNSDLVKELRKWLHKDYNWVDAGEELMEMDDEISEYTTEGYVIRPDVLEYQEGVDGIEPRTGEIVTNVKDIIEGLRVMLEGKKEERRKRKEEEREMSEENEEEKEKNEKEYEEEINRIKNMINKLEEEKVLFKTRNVYSTGFTMRVPGDVYDRITGRRNLLNSMYEIIPDKLKLRKAYLDKIKKQNEHKKSIQPKIKIALPKRDSAEKKKEEVKPKRNVTNTSIRIEKIKGLEKDLKGYKEDLELLNKKIEEDKSKQISNSENLVKRQQIINLINTIGKRLSDLKLQEEERRMKERLNIQWLSNFVKSKSKADAQVETHEVKKKKEVDMEIVQEPTMAKVGEIRQEEKMQEVVEQAIVDLSNPEKAGTKAMEDKNPDNPIEVIEIDDEKTIDSQLAADLPPAMSQDIRNMFVPPSIKQEPDTQFLN